MNAGTTVGVRRAITSGATTLALLVGPIGTGGQVSRPFEPSASMVVATPRSNLTSLVPRVDASTNAKQHRKEAAMVSKLQEIAALPDGWLGPGSRHVDRSVITSFAAALSSYPWIAQTVEVAPSGEGTLVLEWQHDRHFYTVELYHGGTMEFTEDNAVANEVKSETLDTDAKSLAQLIARTAR